VGTATLQLPRSEVEVGFPLTWRFKVPPVGAERCTLLRAILRVYAWRFRQRSAGNHTHTNPSTDPAGGHDHLAMRVLATATAVDKTAFVGIQDGKLVAVADVEVAHPGGAPADVDVRASDVGDHSHAQAATGSATPPAAMGEAEVANANLDITIDGESYKTGLGDGTEKKLLEEEITERIKAPGEHTVEFSMTSLRSGVEAEIELEW